jgi:hypothetical protein
MNSQNFTVSIVVDKTPEQAFAAINDVRGWWKGNIEGKTDVLGQEFTYSYGTLHKTTQKITELVPGKKIVWHVTASYLDFVAEKNEWDGTDVVFEIEKKGDKTEVRFTHVGLAPEVECYDRCSNAWGHYVRQSLRSFIESGSRA